MSTPLQDMRQLLKDDGRFKVEAYQFIREALQYASENVPTPPDMVSKVSNQSASPSENDLASEINSIVDEDDDDASSVPTRHVTGGQLCLACRDYALEQYGFLSGMVLGTWGIRSTSDLGDLVYNLIGIGQMRKSESDRREDFDGVFDFADAFEPEFEIAALGDDSTTGP